MIFFENIDDDHRPQFASPTPPAMVALGPLRILADGRPMRLGGRAFDALMALIEASGAVVGKDELLRLAASESGGVKVWAGASTSGDLWPQLAIRR